MHEYYCVPRFRSAYVDKVPSMPDRDDWPQVDLAYRLYPPLLKRAAGRPRMVKIRGTMEERANKKKVKCRSCKGFGHFAKTWNLTKPREDNDGIDEATTQASLKRYLS